MPIIIPAHKSNKKKTNTDFQENHGHQLTTEKILESLDRILKRPEIDELFEIIKKSDQYSDGGDNATDK